MTREELKKEPLEIGYCVEILPPFSLPNIRERLCVFIRDEEHLRYIRTKNYRIIEKQGK